MLKSWTVLQAFHHFDLTIATVFMHTQRAPTRREKNSKVIIYLTGVKKGTHLFISCYVKSRRSWYHSSVELVSQLRYFRDICLHSAKKHLISFLFLSLFCLKQKKTELPRETSSSSVGRPVPHKELNCHISKTRQELNCHRDSLMTYIEKQNQLLSKLIESETPFK